MRRRGEGGAEEAKVVIQKDSKQSKKKKKIIALRFPRSFHTTFGWTIISLLRVFVC